MNKLKINYATLYIILYYNIAIYSGRLGHQSQIYTVHATYLVCGIHSWYKIVGIQCDGGPKPTTGITDPRVSLHKMTAYTNNELLTHTSSPS